MSSEPPEQIGPGALVLIVGPSGSGKDTVLSEVKEQLRKVPGYCFPTRIITRKSHLSEDHHSVADDEFLAGLRNGAFALTWEAHGLHYALPGSIDAAIRLGQCVVVNGSRTIVDLARSRYQRSAVVLIDSPVEVRTRRLTSRGRESALDVISRLHRTVDTFRCTDADLVVDNSGSLADSVSKLSGFLLSEACKPIL